MHASKYIYLLAYATSARAATPRANGNPNRDVSFDGGSADEEDLLGSTLRAVRTVAAICQANAFGSELQAASGDLRCNLVHPVVAMGILQWIRTNLTDPAYCTTTINTLRTPFYLELLREVHPISPSKIISSTDLFNMAFFPHKISFKHTFLRATVFQLLTDCFEMDYDLDALAAVPLPSSNQNLPATECTLNYSARTPVLLTFTAE